MEKLTQATGARARGSAGAALFVARTGVPRGLGVLAIEDAAAAAAALTPTDVAGNTKTLSARSPCRAA